MPTQAGLIAFCTGKSKVVLSSLREYGRPVTKKKLMKKGSAYTDELPLGCVLCEKGAKLVLLVTGKCRRRCVYCPLSGAKRGRDVFFANERRIDGISEAIAEARTIDALGTGVTGGDPLVMPNRTVAAIKALKREFGKEHHIHLYTSTANPQAIRRVARAGLDEIRFHPPIRLWKRLRSSPFADAIAASQEEGMTVGLEVPVIPGRYADLNAALSFASASGLDFVNLNELEISETNWEALCRHGMTARDDLSSGVAGSEQLALRLLEEEHGLPVHYCSSAFKDGVQLRNRIARRAKNVRKVHEIVTADSTLVKGVIETDDVAGVMKLLTDRYDVPPDLIWRDREKDRLEVAAWVLEEISAELPLESYVVEEYPTADRLEVERRPLMRR